MTDIYESATDQTSRFGAVFECDDDTAYFYLVQLDESRSPKILEAFNIGQAKSLSGQTHVAIRWNAANDEAGLLIDGCLVALFDLKSKGQQGRRANDGDQARFDVN